jgi:hypothetical protein
MPAGDRVDNERAIVSTNLIADPTNVSISGTTARSAQLAIGTYEITADVDCWVLQGTVAVDATTSSNPLWSKHYRDITVGVTDVDDYVAAITAGGSGTLSISKR